MHCVKLLGQRRMARDVDRQVAELQSRVAVPNGYTAPAIPVTKVAGLVCPAETEGRPSDDLCKRAPCICLRKTSFSAGIPLSTDRAVVRSSA
jgi:hypothetical protein